MKPIEGQTRAETWLKAATHLQSCDGWEDYNLVLEVRDPRLVTPADQIVQARLDALLRGSGALPLNSVADTIFPAHEYRRYDKRGVYETYPDEVFPRIRPMLNWGTYAYRLVRGKARDGKLINPLETCVEKMKRQAAKPTGMKRACSELSLVGEEDFYELPLYSPANDQNDTFGFPCLSHISLKVTRDRRLNLTALYRSHYYVERALGNLLGLARLQEFICKQVGLSTGSLVCVSTHARLDVGTGRGKKRVIELLAGLTAAAAA